VKAMIVQRINMKLSPCPHQLLVFVTEKMEVNNRLLSEVVLGGDEFTYGALFSTTRGTMAQPAVSCAGSPLRLLSIALSRRPLRAGPAPRTPGNNGTKRRPAPARPLRPSLDRPSASVRRWTRLANNPCPCSTPATIEYS